MRLKIQAGVLLGWVLVLSACSSPGPAPEDIRATSGEQIQAGTGSPEAVLTAGGELDPTVTATMIPATSSPTPAPTRTPSPTPSATPSPTPSPTLIGGFPGLMARVEKSGNQQLLYLYSAAGARLQLLFTYPIDTTDRYTDYSRVRWSPTGERLVVLYWQDGGYLHLFDREGSELAALDTGIHFYGGLIGQANWSPDGEWLVFSSRGENTYSDLYLMDKDGGSLRQLTNTYGKDSSPSFSPDGRKIVWYREDQWRLLDLESGEQERLPVPFYYDWSADGRWILFKSTERRLNLLDTETRATEMVISLAQKTYLHACMFSPDGTWVYYSYYSWPAPGNRDPRFGEHWYAASVDDLEHLVYIGSGYLSVSPDEKLLFLHGWHADERIFGEPRVYALQPDGTGRVPLSNYMKFLLAGQWQPGSTAAVGLDPAGLFGPTPVPAWDRRPEAELFDDFETGDLAADRWRRRAADGEGIAVQVWQGVLNLQSSRENRGEGVQLEAIGGGRAPLEVLEAEVILRSSTYNGAYASLQLYTDIASRRWFTRCRLGNDWEAPFMVCEVATGESGQFQTEYLTRDIPIQRNTWYRVRIEVHPTLGALQWYLDGEPVATYRPEDADWLVDGRRLNASLGAWSDGRVDAGFEAVWISP